MRNSNARSLLVIAGILAVLATLFSFAPLPGGDSFTISVSGKVLVRQALHEDKSIKTVYLDSDSMDDEMSVTFSHCGKTGTARNLQIRDSKNKTLKSWHFPDAADNERRMTIMVRDIIAVRKAGSGKLDLFYTCDELRNGLVLAAIDISTGTKAGL